MPDQYELSRPSAWPARVPRSIPVPQTSLWDNLEISATRYPGKPALVFFGRCFGFAEVRAMAQRLAGWLQRDAGVNPGDRVLLMTQNSPQFVIACYSIMRADAVVVPVNPMTSAEEIPHYVADPAASVAIVSAEFAARLESANALLPEGARLRLILVTRYQDCMPESVDPADEPPRLARLAAGAVAGAPVGDAMG